MTTITPDSEEIAPMNSTDEGAAVTTQPKAEEQGEGKRRILLLLLLLLLFLCCCSGYFIIRYLAKPQPLPEMLPVVNQNINYPPTYKFSIPLDAPMGVAVSPDGQRIYGTESKKDQLVKMFDRDGKLITSFAPPFTTNANRSLTYIAVDPGGRVFVADTYNDVIAVFDKDGNFLDGIIAKNATLSSIVTQKTGKKPPAGSIIYFDGVNQAVVYQAPGEPVQRFPAPDRAGWALIGLRFDPTGNLLVTLTAAGKHEVLIYSAADIQGSWIEFNPKLREFGEEGKGNGQFSFPNTAVVDNKGNFYVSDGNNGRISLWMPDLKYKTFFGFGSAENALNLPRGNWMDSRERLHVADAVGAAIRVYDVSGTEPVFLFSFGAYGTAEGEFNFPNDVCIDGTGRLYIADRENNRIQVWSY